MFSRTRSSEAARARAYWNVDGLPEIFWSLLYLLFGLQELTGFLKTDVWQQHLTNISFVLTLLSSRYWSPRLLEHLKRRLTYPRTGYVPAPLSYEEKLDARWQILSIRPEPPTASSARLELWMTQYDNRAPGTMLLGFALILLMFLFPFRWAPALLTALAALVFSRVQDQSGFPFHSIVFCSLPAVGLVVSALDGPVLLRVPAVIIAFGSTGLLTGIVTLLRYLHQHPAQGLSHLYDRDSGKS